METVYGRPERWIVWVVLPAGVTYILRRLLLSYTFIHIVNKLGMARPPSFQQLSAAVHPTFSQSFPNNAHSNQRSHCDPFI